MLDYIIWYYSGQKNDNFSKSKGPNQTDPKKAWVLVLDPDRVFGLSPKQKSTNVQNFWHSKVFGSKNFWLFLKLLNPFCSTCIKFFFQWNTFKYAETFFGKKKLSSGSAFTKCETGVTLKLLTFISSEFLLCNKKIFLSKLRILMFIYKKNFKLFRHIFIQL